MPTSKPERHREAADIIGSMVATGPVFISYARKDYYFAESLAFHLRRCNVPVWLDAKDLQPGDDWQQQLEGALDNAACVLLVVSGESLNRPSVRMEWERARTNGTRIIVVVFRKARVPQELSQCELVDFRSTFTNSLRTLVQSLSGLTTDAKSRSVWLPFPWWILTISLTLLIPLICYFLLASWNSDAQGAGRVFLWIGGALLLFSFFWFFCLSFLRRRMGMTHLAACFAFPAIWSLYPLLRYWLLGASNVPAVWRAVIDRNPAPMELSSAVTLAGIAIILLIRPEDLLRWTPTGKAWGWYRERALAGYLGVDSPSILRKVKTFTMLHDAMDGPAAKRLRKELKDLGASESSTLAPDGTTILLLTSRTHTQWLTDQTEKLRSNVLTVVGSRIGLPEQFAWLWKREWIDFRHWDLQRLDRRRGLLQVPEAVTGVRYPTVVRIVHQLLCALTALPFCLFILADPGFNHKPAGAETTGAENLQVLAVFAICAWCGTLAQRLLNRTVAQPGFDKAWKSGLAATWILAIWALFKGTQNQVAWWKLFPLAGFLLILPLLLTARREELAFWFPTPGMSRPGFTERLRPGGHWQTLLWTAVYLFVWAYFVGMYND